MRIPKKIKLLNQTIDIKIDNDFCDAKSVLGQANINHNEIVLCTRHEGRAVPVDRQAHTLMHELAHFIFFLVGRVDLYTDELLADTFATILHDLLENNNFKL